MPRKASITSINYRYFGTCGTTRGFVEQPFIGKRHRYRGAF